MQDLIVHSLLWLIASIRRHPWRWIISILIWLLFQMSLGVAVAKTLGFLGNILGKAFQKAAVKAFNWLFATEHRPWWLWLLLALLIPPLGWMLLLWHVLDYCRPGPQITIAPTFESETG